MACSVKVEFDMVNHHFWNGCSLLGAGGGKKSNHFTVLVGLMIATCFEYQPN